MEPLQNPRPFTTAPADQMTTSTPAPKRKGGNDTATPQAGPSPSVVFSPSAVQARTQTYDPNIEIVNSKTDRQLKFIEFLNGSDSGHRHWHSSATQPQVRKIVKSQRQMETLQPHSPSSTYFYPITAIFEGKKVTDKQPVSIEFTNKNSDKFTVTLDPAAVKSLYVNTVLFVDPLLKIDQSPLLKDDIEQTSLLFLALFNAQLFDLTDEDLAFISQSYLTLQKQEPSTPAHSGATNGDGTEAPQRSGVKCQLSLNGSFRVNPLETSTHSPGSVSTSFRNISHHADDSELLLRNFKSSPYYHLLNEHSQSVIESLTTITEETYQILPKNPNYDICFEASSAPIVSFVAPYESEEEEEDAAACARDSINKSEFINDYKLNLARILNEYYQCESPMEFYDDFTNLKEIVSILESLLFEPKYQDPSKAGFDTLMEIYETCTSIVRDYAITFDRFDMDTFDMDTFISKYQALKDKKPLSKETQAELETMDVELEQYVNTLQSNVQETLITLIDTLFMMTIQL